MTTRHAGWALLRQHPAYRRLWVALTLSAVSLETGWMAVLWLAVERGGSGAAVGGTLLAYGLPAGATALLAGVLLDRFPRHRVVAADQFLRAAILGGAALVGFSAPDGDLAWVYALTLALGAVTPVTQAGAPALVAEVLPEDQLEPANFLSQVQWQVAVLLGPPLGGALVDRWGPAPVLALTAGLCLMSGAMIAGLGGAAAASRRAPRHGILSFTDLTEGLRYLRATPPLLALTALTLGFNLLYGPMEVVLPLLAERQLGGASALGLLWLAYAVGSMAGSAWFSARPWPLSPSTTLALVPVAWGLVTAGIALTGDLYAWSGLMLAGGLAFAPYPPVATTARQRIVPRELHGRIFGVSTAVTSAGVPLGAWLGGLLSDAVGPRGVLWASGVATVALGLAFWALPWLRPLDAAEPAPPAMPRLPGQPLRHRRP